MAGKATPKYAQIANDLRAAIEAGEYQPGDRLPGENALIAQYKTSRGTARDALAVLRDEGLTDTRRGAGVFVRNFKMLRRNAAERLSRKVWGAGRSIWDSDTAERGHEEAVEVSTVEAPDYIAGALGLQPGELVVRRSRLHHVEGRVVQQSASYLPAEIVAGTRIATPDTGPGGMYARLLDLGFPPARFREEVRVRMPLTEQARALGVPPTTPVIHIVRTAFTADDRPIEVNEMLLDSNTYLLEYDFSA